jgi:hypothetical protein
MVCHKSKVTALLLFGITTKAIEELALDLLQ